MSEGINFYKRASRNKDSLIESHINFVIKTANKFKNRNLPIDDLIQEGMLGLTEAYQKFDESRGYKFSTFARHYVNLHILSYIMLNSSHVTLKINAKTNRLFFNLAKEKEKIEAFSDNLTQDQIAYLAKKLMVDSEEIIDINSLLSGDIHLDYSMNDESGSTFKDNLVDETQSIEDAIALQEDERLKWDMVQDGIKKLSPRQKQIMNDLYFSNGNNMTVCDVAKKYHVSSSYIYFVKNKSLEKLKESCNKKLKKRLYFN